MQFKESRKIIESIFRKRRKKSTKVVEKKELQSKAAFEASLVSKVEGQQKTKLDVPQEPVVSKAIEQLEFRKSKKFKAPW